MSHSLRAELHRDSRDQSNKVVLRDRGLGAVVLDELPDIFGTYVSAHDLLEDIRNNLRDMYFYCAPRSDQKVIHMTWEQALATSDFLKGTI